MARNPNRIPEILDALRELWEQNPDLRLGQVIKFAAKAGGWTTENVFYCGDFTMLKGLRKAKERTEG